MTIVSHQSIGCECGHSKALHDAYGCAAFLGGFPDTKDSKTYCPCRRPREDTGEQAAPSGRSEEVVAVVRVRERRGSAIGVCEFPPALELDASAERVVSRVKDRLREVITPKPEPQWVLVIREDLDELRVEALR